MSLCLQWEIYGRRTNSVSRKRYNPKNPCYPRRSEEQTTETNIRRLLRLRKNGKKNKPPILWRRLYRNKRHKELGVVERIYKLKPSHAM